LGGWGGGEGWGELGQERGRAAGDKHRERGGVEGWGGG